MGFCHSLREFLVDYLSLFREGRLGVLVLVLRLQKGGGSGRRRIGLVLGCLLRTRLIVILLVFVQCMGLLRKGL